MSFSEFKQVEQNWSSLTKTANDLYHQDDYQAAANYYKQALFYSELMLRNADNAKILNIHIASPFYESCLNMANNFWALNDLKKAESYFFYNVWQLKMLSKKTDVSEETHSEAIKNWEKAILYLVDFYNKTNQKLTVDFWKEETYEQIQGTRQLLVKRQTDLN